MAIFRDPGQNFDPENREIMTVDASKRGPHDYTFFVVRYETAYIYYRAYLKTNTNSKIVLEDIKLDAMGRTEDWTANNFLTF